VRAGVAVEKVVTAKLTPRLSSKEPGPCGKYGLAVVADAASRPRHGNPSASVTVQIDRLLFAGGRD